MNKQCYTTPQIEVIEVLIENGFAQSHNAPINPWNPDEI